MVGSDSDLVHLLISSFRAPGLVSPDSFFRVQLGILKNALTNNCFIMGDFNLDVNMEHRLDYHYRIPFNLKLILPLKVTSPRL